MQLVNHETFRGLKRVLVHGICVALVEYPASDTVRVMHYEGYMTTGEQKVIHIDELERYINKHIDHAKVEAQAKLLPIRKVSQVAVQTVVDESIKRRNEPPNTQIGLFDL